MVMVSSPGNPFRGVRQQENAPAADKYGTHQRNKPVFGFQVKPGLRSETADRAHPLDTFHQLAFHEPHRASIIFLCHFAFNRLLIQ